MARYVRISAVAPRPPEINPHKSMQACVDEMIAHWDRWLGPVLCDRPDLIVLPEVCDRPGNFNQAQQLEYYAARGNRVRDHFMGVARAHQCQIAYSAVRTLPDGSARNSTQFINRRGEIDGIYNKNHLTHGEHFEAHLLYGKDAPVIRTDCGRLAGVICFDLNYKELREKYEQSKPEILIFSSMYHGGLMQSYWAYACRAWFIGCVSGDQCTVINPVGDLVARSTNYQAYVTAEINLDYRVAHLDYNQEKFKAAKRKYGSQLKIYDPGHLAAVLLTSESDSVTMDEIIKEFDIELWDDYYARSMAERHAPGQIEP